MTMPPQQPPAAAVAPCDPRGRAGARPEWSKGRRGRCCAMRRGGTAPRRLDDQARDGGEVDQAQDGRDDEGDRQRGQEAASGVQAREQAGEQSAHDRAKCECKGFGDVSAR